MGNKGVKIKKVMRLYAARDKNTGNLVNGITNSNRKFWEKKGSCESAIKRCRWKDYDLELVVFELVEVKETAE